VDALPAAGAHSWAEGWGLVKITHADMALGNGGCLFHSDCPLWFRLNTVQSVCPFVRTAAEGSACSLRCAWAPY
jgi:hypothetical protein